ncbi:hypothetical protein ACHAXA_008758 [Cyclostephanos tholiformis]|uniref:Uncharacterized protein n=1 Tax=Cyclostephanos tholiformis TaxID=382380 RepID=A0ABD3RDE4_9STRA
MAGIGTTTPAFEGANFDDTGGCLRHPDVRLMLKVTAGGGGAVVYKELMRRCPKCAAPGPTTQVAPPQSPRSPSTSSPYTKTSTQTTTGAATGIRHSPGAGGGVNDGHRTGRGGPNATASLSGQSRARSKSPAIRGVGSPVGRDKNDDDDDDDNDDARSKSSNGSRWRRLNAGGGRDASMSMSPARSRSATRRPRRVYDTPFDVKGRCHHHPNMQLAKKKLTGGWKVLLAHCPKCLEDEYINNPIKRSLTSRRSSRSASRARGNSPEDRSVSSRRSIKSSGGGIYNRNQNNDNSDDRSVFSRLSIRSLGDDAPDDKSVFSRLSTLSSGRGGRNQNDASEEKSVFSRLSTSLLRQGSGGGDRRTTTNAASKQGALQSTTSRYECPFGLYPFLTYYTCGSSILTGGWKIIRDACVECTNEQDDDNRSTGSRNSRKSAASNGSKKFVGRKSAGGKGRQAVDYSDTDSESNSIHLKRSQKKSASHHDPSPRNGKCDKDKEPTKGTSHKRSNTVGSIRDATEKRKHEWKKQVMTDDNILGDDQRQRALKEYKDLYNKTARVVKNMIFEDVFGDLGRYTGEVNDEKIPHGMGDIVYDDGLVEGGTWTNGVLDERW